MSVAKERQAAKIKEISEALATVGYLTLPQQAQALGLCRSTAWTVVKGAHKASGLSAHLINQMLASPQLPLPVRDVIVSYVCERLQGTYGHNKKQLRGFASRLTGTPVPTATEIIESLQHRQSRGGQRTNSPHLAPGSPMQSKGEKCSPQCSAPSDDAMHINRARDALLQGVPRVE